MCNKPSGIANFRVQEALLCMQNCYQDQHICLASVAKRAGVSRCYLSRILGLKTGKRFRQHLRAIRMQHAAELLRDPLLTIKEISWAVGYAHPSTFDRDFRAVFHSSPMGVRCARTLLSTQSLAATIKRGARPKEAAHVT